MEERMMRGKEVALAERAGRGPWERQRVQEEEEEELVVGMMHRVFYLSFHA
jgi:hypothetical protein